MLKGKKLLIAAIAFFVMFPLCMIKLSSISEEFIALGVYCIVGACFCFISYLKLKSNEHTGFILLGLGILFAGFIFKGALSEYSIYVNTLISPLLMVIGFILSSKGIKEKLNKKRNLVYIRPINKLIYIGSGTLIYGIVISISLFKVFPLLMSLGHVILMAGVILFLRGVNITINTNYNDVNSMNTN